MANDFLPNALVMTASALARQQGLELVVDENATTFATNGRQLVMPPVDRLQKRFPDPSKLSAYLLGAIVHEAGHILYTDFEARTLWRKRYEGHPEQKIAEFFGQAIEDVVIERRQCRELAGAPMILVDMWKLLKEEHEQRERPLQEDERKCLARWLFACCRHTVLQQPWTESALTLEADRARMTCPSDRANQFADELALLQFARTTADGIAVADRLLLVLGIEATEKADLPEQEDPGAQGPAEAGRKDSEDPSAPTSAAGEAQGPAEAGRKDSEDSSAPTSAPGEAANNGATEPASADDGVLALVAFVEGEGEEEGIPVGDCVAPGQGWAANDTALTVGAGHQLKVQVLTASMGAAAKLTSLLLADTTESYEYGRRGKVVASRLWKLKGGNTRVFRRVTEARVLSTGIKILADRSLSLKGHIHLVRQAAAFLPVAFQGIAGLQTSIDVFPGVGRSLTRVKRFDQWFDSCADELASTDAEGGTPLGAALQDAAADLLALEVDRHILLVPSDGQPDRNERPPSRRVIVELEAAGVEVIGIGIGVDLGHLFNDFVRISRVEELTDALYEVIVRKMVMLREGSVTRLPLPKG